MVDIRMLSKRARAYRDTFERADTVLADLKGFCHAQKTTHVLGDPQGSAQLEGRRQVWLRIQGYLHMTDDQINQLTREQ